jgi:hypothetical protein
MKLRRRGTYAWRISCIRGAYAEHATVTSWTRPLWLRRLAAGDAAGQMTASRSTLKELESKFADLDGRIRDLLADHV